MEVFPKRKKSFCADLAIGTVVCECKQRKSLDFRVISRANATGSGIAANPSLLSMMMEIIVISLESNADANAAFGGLKRLGRSERKHKS